MRARVILSCLVWVVICLLIGAISGWLNSTADTAWLVNLHKPIFNPPSWLFAPVWTVLYVMIGLAGGLIWCVRRKSPLLLTLYIWQLLLNFIWTFIFFGAHQIEWALVDIILLWLSLIWLIYLACRAKRKAVVLLLLPYFLWLTFATILNASLLLLSF